MTPFPAQWHHLAVENSLNSPPDPLCLPPSSFLPPLSWGVGGAKWLSSGHFSGFYKHPKTAVTVWFCIYLSPLLAAFLPVFHIVSLLASPWAFLPSTSISVCRWQLHSWGAPRGKRKQRFGSVALILIFRRLDGRLGGAFIHTPYNRFPLQMQKKKNWLQTTGVASYQHKCAICDKASLCFVPKTVICLGTQCTEQRFQRRKKSWCKNARQGGESETKTQWGVYNPKVKYHLQKINQKLTVQ